MLLLPTIAFNASHCRPSRLGPSQVTLAPLQLLKCQVVLGRAHEHQQVTHSSVMKSLCISWKEVEKTHGPRTFFMRGSGTCR